MNAISEIPTRTLIAEIRRRHSQGHDVPAEEMTQEMIQTNLSDAIISITQMVAGIFGVATGALLGSSRLGPLAEARFATWLILRDRGYLPCEIAPVFRRLDTGTVRHGCNRGRQLIQADPRFARRLKQALDLVAATATAPVRA
jgi:chromosomal replication initiation ATPase DnaA